MVQIGPNLSKLVKTLHILSFFVDGIVAKDIGEELRSKLYKVV